MGFSDRKISNYLNYNGIKTNRGKKFSCGLVWMLRKKYYKSKLREQIYKELVDWMTVQ